MDGYELDDAAVDLNAEAPDAAALAGQVWRRVAAAVARGLLREAQGWAKLWRELSAVARAETGGREVAVSARPTALATSSALPGTPDAGPELHPAHAEKSFTRRRKGAKRVDDPGARLAPVPTAALRENEATPSHADPSLRGFAPSREPSCFSEPSDAAADAESCSVRSVSERAPSERTRSPPLNRAERRRRERLAAAQAWKARALGVRRGSETASAPTPP